jgi:dihydrodipicolinate synthase/N-acetylneuraminate lyase
MTSRLASGIIVAAILPFTDSDEIDWPTHERYIAQVAEGGPTAIAINMAVAEVSSLTEDEQLAIVRRTKAVLSGRCTLLSGVNVTNTAAARVLSKRMVDAGAEGIVIFPPVPAFLGPPPPISMIVDYHAAIADAVPRVPLVAFQPPFVTYPKGTITELSKIESIVSIKDASFDVDKTIDNINEAKTAPRRIGVLTGSDTFILEAMMMGCDGALIGFAATATAEVVRMRRLVTEGKITEAYEIWSKLGPLARICWRQPLRDYRVRMKYTMMKQGILPNCRVRAPFPQLTEQDRADLDKVFKDMSIGDARFLPAGKAAVRAPLKAAG